jgi:hypothetical protein
MIETFKQEAQTLLADVRKEQTFLLKDGQVFRNMKQLGEGFKTVSGEINKSHAKPGKTQ